jgi:hypothetical protein
MTRIPFIEAIVIAIVTVKVDKWISGTVMVMQVRVNNITRVMPCDR